MFMLMFGTFVSAGFADLGTQGADRFGKFAAPRHKGRGGSANLGTIDIQRDTTSHGFRIGFLQASDGAVIAGGGTVATGSNTTLILGM